MESMQSSGKGWWFKTRVVFSLLCCFLRQETLLHIFSLHSGVKMGNKDTLPITYCWGSPCNGLASHPGVGN